MSKRDRNAIIALVIIIFVFVPLYFVTVPVIKHNSKLRVEQTEQLAKKEEFLLNEKLYQQRVIELDELSREIEDLRATLPDLSKSYNSHYAFIGMAEKNSVLITNLAIGEITRYITEEEKALEEADLQNPDKTEPATSEANVLTYQLELTLDVNGSIENIFKLTDSINAYNKNVAITKLTLDTKTDVDAGTSKATVVVGIYMALTREEAGVKL